MRESEEEFLLNDNGMPGHSNGICHDFSPQLPYAYSKGLPSDEILEDSNSLDAKPFRCSVPNCGRAFTSKFKLMRHALIHTEERQFKCQECGRCFHRKDHLKNHMQVHNPHKTYHTCEQCNKQYTSAMSYRKHMALHAAESGDLQCKICSERFGNKDQVLSHLKVHSGSRALKGSNERRFNCEQCHRAFFTRKDVKRHHVVHTGLRNFCCKYCPQKFGRKDHLVRHVKKSHANISYYSSSSASSSSTIDEHKYIVNGNANGHNGHAVHLLNGNGNSHNGHIMNDNHIETKAPIQHILTNGHSHLLHNGNLINGHHPDPVIKQESCYSPGGSSNSLIHNGNDEGFLRMGDLLPLSQTPQYSMPTYSPSIPHINCYINPMIAHDSLIQTIPTSSFSQVSLEMVNTSLPHFNQAFQ